MERPHQSTRSKWPIALGEPLDLERDLVPSPPHHVFPVDRVDLVDILERGELQPLLTRHTPTQSRTRRLHPELLPARRGKGVHAQLAARGKGRRRGREERQVDAVMYPVGGIVSGTGEEERQGAQ